MNAYARVKERPIIFSGPMVRAILEGRKTQTRRIMKVQPVYVQYDNLPGQIGLPYKVPRKNEATYEYPPGNPRRQFKFEIAQHCPYGQPGDRLWVRETWAQAYDHSFEPEGEFAYRADGGELPGRFFKGWKPSIHMPRAASRILLEIVSVRVERLQDISRADAIAEGLIKQPFAPAYATEKGCDWGFEGDSRHGSPISAFATLWDSINGKKAKGPGSSWFSNPWVWVVEFKRVGA